MELGLWSMLSTAVVVNRFWLRLRGQTTFSAWNCALTLFPSSLLGLCYMKQKVQGGIACQPILFFCFLHVTGCLHTLAVAFHILYLCVIESLWCRTAELNLISCDTVRAAWLSTMLLDQVLVLVPPIIIAINVGKTAGLRLLDSSFQTYRESDYFQG